MRRLIVCCDGTWKAAESATLTNVTYTARAIAPIASDGVPQIVLHDPGVGTGNLMDRIGGGALGRGLDENVKDCYRFLVYNYEPGDDVMVFGFSRGAYTARSTVGMIRKCGLLRKPNAGRLGDAYNLYRRRDDEVDGPEATAFRTAYSWPRLEIAFLGVWDTVGSLGIPLAGLRWLTRRKYQFHDVRLSRIVKRACHAVAIDERRGAFAPTLWETQPDSTQTVEQTWFVGVHSDVGGGYEDRGLASITLQWMVKRAYDAGLEFNHQYLHDELAIDLTKPANTDAANVGATLHNSRTGLYLLTRTHIRPIGRDSSRREAVWHTAKNRADDATLDYAPRNLVDYLASPRPVISGPDGMPTGAQVIR